MSFDPESYTQTQQLEALKFGMRQVLDTDFVNDVEIVAQDLFYSMGRDIAYEFRKKVWADKLANETVKATQELLVGIWVPLWDSAWQLWKHNHKDSKLFGWIHKWWPADRGTYLASEKQQVTVEVNIKKYLTFPEFQAPPSQFGNYYRYVQTTPVRMWWDNA